jgi:hypothetical protein
MASVDCDALAFPDASRRAIVQTAPDRMKRNDHVEAA